MRNRGRPSKAIRHRRKRRSLFFIIWTVILLLLLFGLRTAAHLDFWRISEVVIEGANKLNQKEVETSVQDHLDGSYWWVIPKDNTLFYPKSSIRHALTEKHNRLHEVSVSRKGLDTIVVQLFERNPYAVFCVSDKPCFFLDKVGFIFDETEEKDNQEMIRFSKAASSTDDIGTGDYFYESDSFERVVDFLGRVKQLDLEPRSVVQESEFVFQVNLSDGRYLLINPEDDLESVFDNLKLLLSHNDLPLSAEDSSSFSYIDLRFGDRIFYNTLTQPEDSQNELGQQEIE